MDNLEQILEEIELQKEGRLKPIKSGEGLISYRKYLWALKFIEEKIIRLKDYKEEVIKNIDEGIEKEMRAIDNIRRAIEEAMIQEPMADRTKTGGRALSLPDIATISLSKPQDKIEITDEESVLEALGQEFSKIVVSLDRKKAKKYILETGKIPEGAIKKQERTLSIRFKK